MEVFRRIERLYLSRVPGLEGLGIRWWECFIIVKSHIMFDITGKGVESQLEGLNQHLMLGCAWGPVTHSVGNLETWILRISWPGGSWQLTIIFGEPKDHNVNRPEPLSLSPHENPQDLMLHVNIETFSMFRGNGTTPELTAQLSMLALPLDPWSGVRFWISISIGEQ